MSEIKKLELSEIPTFKRMVNEKLMVAFINSRLVDRAHLDVKKSIVFYDDELCFLYADATVPSEYTMKELYESTKIRFYSEGV